MSKIKVKCFRFDPSIEKEPRYQEYEVPVNGEMSVLDVLDYIYENIDASLAYRRNNACNRGLCGDCILKINGKAKLACQQLAKGDLVIEPISKEKVLRDLVVKR
jgi:succinate dehydrogenase/fumarate reductase iron-sulfur protein